MNQSCSIYCLSLLEDSHKQEAAAVHFDRLGLKVSFFHGFHGSTLGLRADLAVDYLPDGSRSFIHPNQLATVLSHLALLRAALRDGLESFLVFEDDVVLCEEWVDLWKKVFAELAKAKASVAQLEYSRGDIPVVLEPSSLYLARCRYPFNASAIWWTREAALTAVRHVRPICEPWDTALIRRVFPFLRHFIVIPQLCHQRSASGEWPSSIGLEWKPLKTAPQAAVVS